MLLPHDALSHPWSHTSSIQSHYLRDIDIAQLHLMAGKNASTIRQT